MRRIGTFGWVLIVAVVVTVVLNVVAPDVGVFAAIVLVLLVFVLAADGIATPGVAIGDDRTGEEITAPKREALARRYRRGRPRWQETAPDHADEPPELIWERERRRRGLE